MDYLCILNAFEQTYYQRIKEIERVAAAAAAAHDNLRANNNHSSNASTTSSAASSTTSSASSTPTSTAASPPTATCSSRTNNNNNHSKNLPINSPPRYQTHEHAAAQQHLQQLQQQTQTQQKLQQHQQHQQQKQRRHLNQQQQLQQLQQRQQQHQQLQLQQQQQQLQQQHQHHVHPQQLQHQHQQQQQQQHNSNVANSLLWQPWRDFQQAAAMHQHFYQQQQQQLQKESRLTSKELPTTKWRRDRRMRTANEYQQQPGSSVASAGTASPPTTPTPPLPPHAVQHGAPMSMMMAAAAAAAAMRPLCESTNRPTPPSSLQSPLGHHNSSMVHSMQHESPIDMSVSSSSMKQRSSPPPPYREPLPGTTFATTLARPSVITQAPPKRGISGDARDSLLISNRENDNRSTESISMCETVIDEHFRRSLGPDYVALFGKKSPSAPSTPSPQPTSPAPTYVPPSLTAAPAYPAAAHQQSQQQHMQHLPPHPQALISPKPTALLLSPTIMASQSRSASPLATQQHQLLQLKQAPVMALPPPQQQPLSLQRHTVAPPAVPMSPQPTTPPASKPMLVQQRATNSPAAIGRASPNVATTPHTPPPATVAGLVAASCASPAATSPPAAMRIKTEPGLGTAALAVASPPASPSYSTTSETPSVDDHFAKALGDTWKQLQAAGKDFRK